MNILIVGKVGTGKTVLVNALAMLLRSSFIMDSKSEVACNDPEGLPEDISLLKKMLKKSRHHPHRHHISAYQISPLPFDEWDIVIYLNNKEVGPWLFDRVSLEQPRTRISLP